MVIEQMADALTTRGVAAKHVAALTSLLVAARTQLKVRGRAIVAVNEVYDAKDQPVAAATLRAAVLAHPKVGALTFTYNASCYHRASDRGRKAGGGGVPAAREAASVTIVKGAK